MFNDIGVDELEGYLVRATIKHMSEESLPVKFMGIQDDGLVFKILHLYLWAGPLDVFKAMNGITAAHYKQIQHFYCIQGDEWMIAACEWRES